MKLSISCALLILWTGCLQADELRDVTYTVPQSVNCLSAAATFTLPHAQLTTSVRGQRTLSYALPQDLVGVGMPDIVLTEKPTSTPVNATVWAGDLATATCSTAEDSTSCNVSYSQTYTPLIDLQAVTAYLQKKYANDPPVLQQKLNTLSCFIHDPEGILAFVVTPTHP